GSSFSARGVPAIAQKENQELVIGQLTRRHRNRGRVAGTPKYPARTQRSKRRHAARLVRVCHQHDERRARGPSCAIAWRRVRHPRRASSMVVALEHYYLDCLSGSRTVRQRPLAAPNRLVEKIYLKRDP